MNKEELMSLITSRGFRDERIKDLVNLIGKPLLNPDKPPFHVNAQPKKGNIYIGCVAQKRVIEPAVAEYFDNLKFNDAQQLVNLVHCISGKWVGSSACIDYVRVFCNGPLQFVGFGQIWSSVKGGYSHAIFGHMYERPKEFTSIEHS